MRLSRLETVNSILRSDICCVTYYVDTFCTYWYFIGEIGISERKNLLMMNISPYRLSFANVRFFFNNWKIKQDNLKNRFIELMFL